MRNYLDLVYSVYQMGYDVPNDRTGIGTRALFGQNLRFDLGHTFPAVTAKRLYFKTMLRELLWFIRGETSTTSLNAKIWDEWADDDGELGPVYGKQWRAWENYIPFSHDDDCQPDYIKGKPIDQLQNVIDSIQSNPFSRRHIVSAWNVADLPRMALAPCHLLYQFNVRRLHRRDRIRWAAKILDESSLEFNQVTARPFLLAEVERNPDYLDENHIPTAVLDCQVYQRSVDLFLGLPFNIASYAALTRMVAQITGYAAGKLIMTFGNLHIYMNHFEQVQEMLSRMPYPAPTLWIDPDISHIDDFREEHFRLSNYQCHPAIQADVAV